MEGMQSESGEKKRTLIMVRRAEAERQGDIFLFQAEDGIRVRLVTGVQTCALPISPPGLVLWCTEGLPTSTPQDGPDGN